MTANPIRPRATFTVEEAARLIGISRGAAYRGIASGQIPAIRVGRRLLVPAAPLYQLLGLTHDGAPVPPTDAPNGQGKKRTVSTTDYVVSSANPRR